MRAEAAGVPALGDIDRAIHSVSVARRRWAGVVGVAATVLVLAMALIGPSSRPLAVEPAVRQPNPTTAPALDAPASRLVATIPMEAGHIDGIAVDPGTGSVWVAGGRDAVSVIDSGTRRVIDTVSMGGRVSAIAVDFAAGLAYATYPEARTVAVLDTATRELIGVVGVGGGPGPVAVDPAAGAVYVGNRDDGTVSVIDTFTREVVDTVTVGEPFDPTMGWGSWGLVVDPGSGDVYVANGHTMSVIDRDTHQVADTTTGPDPVTTMLTFAGPTVAMNPATGEAYVASSADGTVSVIDTRTRQLVDTVEVGGLAAGVAVDPRAGVVYVNGCDTSCDNHAVVVIDSGTHKVIDTISGSPPGWVPRGIAVDPTSGGVYVTTWDSNGGAADVLVFGAR